MPAWLPSAAKLRALTVTTRPRRSFRRETTRPLRCQNAFGVGDRWKRKKGVRLDRRRPRLRLLLLMGVFILALLPNLDAPSVAAPRASGQIVANDVSQPWPSHRAGALSAPNGASILAADAGSTGG